MCVDITGCSAVQSQHCCRTCVNGCLWASKSTLSRLELVHYDDSALLLETAADTAHQVTRKMSPTYTNHTTPLPSVKSEYLLTEKKQYCTIAGVVSPRDSESRPGIFKNKGKNENHNRTREQ